jgi:hypothetical protein
MGQYPGFPTNLRGKGYIVGPLRMYVFAWTIARVKTTKQAVPDIIALSER